MRYSEKNDVIIKKIMRVTEKLEPLKKDKDNPYYKSKYADHLQIWTMLKKPCEEEGLLVQHGGNIIWSNNDTAFFNVITRVTDIESGQWCENDMPLALEKATPQGCGSAMTYGSRYGTEGMFNMAREGADDDGNAAESRPPQAKRYEKPNARTQPSTSKGTASSPNKGTEGYVSDRQGAISTVGKDGKGKGQLGYLYVMMKKAGVSEDALRAHLSANYEYPEGQPMSHIRDLNTGEMNEVLEWLEGQK